MRKTIFCLIAAVIIVLGALSPAISSAQAQTPPPPREPERQQPCLPGQPCEDENGDRFIIPTEETLAAPTAIGDSDDYGYTLSSATYSWISAADGINTGIDETRDITAAISLPFAFPFYENSYTQLYITGAGYLTFDDYDWVNWGYFLPDENEPNNFISVLSKYQYYSGSAVYYKSFGTHFVVQWNHLLDGNGGVYTFEAILYPDGNIKFQYRTLPDPSSGYYCSTAGIENATGLDGLAFWNWCQRPTTAGTAVLITKPGPSARVGANPLYLGEFAYSLDVDDFNFTITNTGDLGADTYDMTVTTAPMGGGWIVELFDAATEVPLSDTDADGTIDSGSLSQGESKGIRVRVSAPAGLTLGAAIETYIDVTSSLDPAKTKTVTIESTVPAPFAQTYRDGNGSILRTDLNWPAKQVTADIYEQAWNVYQPSIIETLDHSFVHVWTDYDWGQYANGWVLRYAVMDRYGQVIKAPETLSSIFDGEGYYTENSEPTLAVTQDGKIGVVWTRRLSYSDGADNYNIWFAIIDPSGTIAYGPVNLTNNDAWGSYSWGNRVQLVTPDISASEDNRFFITWRKSDQSVSTQDIHYSICQSSGAMVVQPTAMTTSDWTQRYYPGAQIALSGNRFFVSYQYLYISGQYLYIDQLYRVFDSSGGTLVSPTILDFYADTAVQLSGGNILLVTSWNENEIRYQIRSGTDYALIYQSGSLNHPSTTSIDYRSLAVTKDSNNKGILTWASENLRYLYYAYVQGTNGALLTVPVISHSSDWFGLSYTGSGITTNSWSPAVGVDLVGAFSSGLYGAAPGGVATMKVKYSNIGAGTAEFPELTMTLPAGLTYVGDSSGITPDVAGSTVVWQLPELAFASSEDFVVYLAVDGATPVPSFFDVSLQLSSESADANPADNLDTAQVMVGLQVFLPLLLR